MTPSPSAAGTLAREGVLTAFRRFETHVAGASPSWLGDIRRRAAARFAERGLPTTREEAWRYTSLAPLDAAGLELVPERSADALAPLSNEALAPFMLGGPTSIRLVFVDGRYSSKLSTVRPLTGGARAGSLAEALDTDPEMLRATLGEPDEPDDGGLGILNAAFWRDGAFVHVPAGVVLEEPLHLLFVATGAAGKPVIQPRNLIVLDRASEASIVESYASLTSHPHLTNVVTDLRVAEGAGLDHCRVQLERGHAFHVARTGVRQGRDSRLRSCAVVFGGRLMRHDLAVRLTGEGASATLSGLAVLGGRQHLDTHTVVDHERPHGTSRQLYKGVMDGRSRSVFDGRIVVRPGAQKTDAHQINKNLLLSEGVEVDSKPQLEIFADDVKCSHGAADGQLASDALFYVRSRGLGEAAARSLLTWGFAREVLDQIGVADVRARLEELLTERLRGGRVAEESA